MSPFWQIGAARNRPRHDKSGHYGLELIESRSHRGRALAGQQSLPHFSALIKNERRLGNARERVGSKRDLVPEFRAFLGLANRIKAVAMLNSRAWKLSTTSQTLSNATFPTCQGNKLTRGAHIKKSEP